MCQELKNFPLDSTVVQYPENSRAETQKKGLGHDRQNLPARGAECGPKAMKCWFSVPHLCLFAPWVYSPTGSHFRVFLGLCVKLPATGVILPSRGHSIMLEAVLGITARGGQEEPLARVAAKHPAENHLYCWGWAAWPQ